MLALSMGWPIAREILFCPAEGTSPTCEIYYANLCKGPGPCRGKYYITLYKALAHSKTILY
jgi:hypothetical protein